jgi:hypothetical protein
MGYYRAGDMLDLLWGNQAAIDAAVAAGTITQPGGPSSYSWWDKAMVDLSHAGPAIVAVGAGLFTGGVLAGPLAGLAGAAVSTLGSTPLVGPALANMAEGAIGNAGNAVAGAFTAMTPTTPALSHEGVTFAQPPIQSGGGGLSSGPYPRPRRGRVRQPRARARARRHELADVTTLSAPTYPQFAWDNPPR